MAIKAACALLLREQPSLKNLDDSERLAHTCTQEPNAELPMNRIFSVIMLGCAAGCAGMPRTSAMPPDTAVILVRNPTPNPLLTTVCGPLACSEARLMAAGSESRFIVRAGSGTRAVVTAKRGDVVVAQHPVDFSPGDQVRVDIGVSASYSPPRSGASR